MQRRIYYAGGLTVLILLVLVPGCGYPEVSPKTYELAKALYSVSNLKREDGLDKAESLIAEALQSGEITDKEADYLAEIIRHCRAGEWETAQAECRRIMEDQVGTERKPSPHQH